jgi:hypothetical protein
VQVTGKEQVVPDLPFREHRGQGDERVARLLCAQDGTAQARNAEHVVSEGGDASRIDPLGAVTPG